MDLFTFLNYEKLTLDKSQCTSVCRYSQFELSEVQKQDGLGGVDLPYKYFHCVIEREGRSPSVMFLLWIELRDCS